jgi:hypothetical protein
MGEARLEKRFLVKRASNFARTIVLTNCAEVIHSFMSLGGFIIPKSNTPFYRSFAALF